MQLDVQQDHQNNSLANSETKTFRLEQPSFSHLVVIVVVLSLQLHLPTLQEEVLNFHVGLTTPVVLKKKFAMLEQLLMTKVQLISQIVVALVFVMKEVGNVEKFLPLDVQLFLQITNVLSQEVPLMM
jgi:hypothetical protein